MIEAYVREARDGLIMRATRASLAPVGYGLAESPFGPLWVAVGPRGVAVIHYGGEPAESELRRLLRTYGPGIVPDARRTDEVRRELDQYFRGKRRDFDVRFDLAGLTPFQQRVLKATARVRYGDLATYKVVAKRAGNEKASRAAGAALGSNPIPIVVPCHRIVASDGTLGGYSGGLETKRCLLDIERAGDVPEGGWPPARHGPGAATGRRR